MKVLHAAYKVYKIWYHIVMCVKYRKNKFLSRERIEYFEKILYEIKLRYEFDAVGTDENHVHLFIVAPRDIHLPK